MRLIAALVLLVLAGCSGEQRPDNAADVSVVSPRFPDGNGPRVAIDAGHGNYHTIDGGFGPFAGLLRNDGMRVSSLSGRFSDESLSEVEVLVVANADGMSAGPTFTPEEIEAVVRFVEDGGALLLIADHIPYPAAAAALAAPFGFELLDVFAEDDGSGLFTRDNQGLTDDPILLGITQVRTFAGSAFRADQPAVRPLLRLGDGWTMQSLEGDGLSAKRSAEGLLQGALLERGRGRVAVFGEAGMFTAQTTTGWSGERMGFHAEGAEQNKRFILNVMHWLASSDSVSVSGASVTR